MRKLTQGALWAKLGYDSPGHFWWAVRKCPETRIERYRIFRVWAEHQTWQESKSLPYQKQDNSERVVRPPKQKKNAEKCLKTPQKKNWLTKAIELLK